MPGDYELERINQKINKMDIALVRLQTNFENVRSNMEHSVNEMQKDLVKKAEFTPVALLVFTFAGLVFSGFVWALIANVFTIQKHIP